MGVPGIAWMTGESRGMGDSGDSGEEKMSESSESSERSSSSELKLPRELVEVFMEFDKGR